MASAKSFRTAIEFAGKVDSSFMGAVNSVKRSLTSINTAARRTTTAFGAWGKNITGGFRSAMSAVGGFVTSLGGLALGYLGISSIVQVLGDAEERFKAAELSSAKLGAALKNNPILAKQGAKAVQAQQDAIIALAKRMSDASGYSAGIYKNAFATLATYGAGAVEMNKLSGGIANYLAGTKGIKATTEDAVALADKLGKAVTTGKLQRFAQELKMTPKAVKEFGALKTAAERVEYLQKALAGKYGGQSAALLSTDPGKEMAAMNRVNAALTRLGEPVERLHASWLEFAASMVPAITPAIEGVLTAFQKATDLFSKNLNSPEMQSAWNKIGENINKALAPLNRNIGDLIPKSFLEQSDIDAFTNAFAKISEVALSASQAIQNGFAKLQPTLQPVFDAIGYFLKGCDNDVQLLVDSFAAFAKYNFDGLINGINLISNALSGVVTAAKDAIDWLEKLGKMVVNPIINNPAFKPGPAPYGPGNPAPTPGHAAGGVFFHEHLARIAEGGTAEAVIPLRRDARSLGLLDRAQSAIGGQRGSSRPAINITQNLTFNGGDKDVARKVKESLADAMRRAMAEEYRTAFV